MTHSRARMFLVVVLAVLVATAAPAAAATPATLRHTTANDFRNGILSNVEVSGSGTDAYLNYTTAPTRDSENWEDGNTSGWTTSGGSIANSPALGDYSLELEESETATSDDLNYFSAGGTLTYRVYLSDTSTPPAQSNFQFGYQENGAHYRVQIFSDGRLRLGKVDGSGQWTELARNGQSSFPTGEWLEVRVNWGENGQIEVTVLDSSGTELGTVTASDSQFQSGGIGVSAGGYSDPVYFDNIQVDAQQSGSYVSAPFQASAESGWTDLEITDTEVTVEWQGYDGSSWNTLDTSTYTSSGNYSVSLPTTYDRYRTFITFDPVGSNPSVRLLDEGVTFSTVDPTAANVSPPDNYTTTSGEIEFTVDVADGDFADTEGDSVDVELMSAGEVQASTTVTSNETVSINASLPGSGTWHWRLTDEYGNVVTTESRNITTPSTLYIYNQSDPDSLVDGTTVDVQFYFQGDEELTVERTVSDGTIDMGGLPANRPFVVVVDAPGYRPARIYVESLLQTQSVYLLPDDAEYVETIFELRDYTGKFPEENTVLQVQRSLNGEWRTVQADYFGASNEFSTQLRYNVRHRLILQNTNTGETEQVGTYTPTTSGEKIVRVTGEDAILVQESDVEISVRPSVRSLPGTDGATVNVTVASSSGNLTGWSARFLLHNATTGTNTSLDTVSQSDPGTISESFNLTGAGGDTLFVVVEGETPQGTAVETVRYSIREQYTNEYSLINVLGSVPSRLAPGNVDGTMTFMTIVITIIVTTTASAYLRLTPELAGITAVTTLAGFSVIGWVGYNVLYSSIVAFIAFASLRRGL